MHRAIVVGAKIGGYQVRSQKNLSRRGSFRKPRRAHAHQRAKLAAATQEWRTVAPLRGDALFSTCAAASEQLLDHSPANCVSIWHIGQDVPDLSAPLDNDQQQNQESSSKERA